MIYSFILWVAAFTMLLPMIWMISSSFKYSNAVFEFPIRWIPTDPTLDGYRVLFSSNYNFAWYYINTLYVSVMEVTGMLIVGSLAAYAYAKIRFYGRNVIFLSLIGSLAIPFQVVMIPQFIIYKHLFLLDTLTSQWISSFVNPVMAIFFLRQFFKSVPDELIEAAKIDGCGHFRTLRSIVVPIAKPALVTVSLIYFIGAWNNYESALLYLRSPEKYVIALAVKLFSGTMYTNYSAIMAASVISILPLLVVLSFGQKYLIEGLTVGSVKG